MTNPSLLRRLLIALTAVSFLLTGSLIGAPAQARTTALTNTSHLDFLLADVGLAAIPGHTGVAGSDFQHDVEEWLALALAASR